MYDRGKNSLMHLMGSTNDIIGWVKSIYLLDNPLSVLHVFHPGLNMWKQSAHIHTLGEFMIKFHFVFLLLMASKVSSSA